MVNANAKTSNKKRKSLTNLNVENDSPKKTKPNENLNTPGKNKNATKTPNSAKTPKKLAVQNLAKTPKQTPAKAQQKPLAKTPIKQEKVSNAPIKQEKVSNEPIKQEKVSNEPENDGSSPKKLKPFSGTSELDQSKDKINPQSQNQGKASTRKRRGVFFHLREKLNAGDKEALKELETKIQAFESRKELTKTAKRKLKMLMKIKTALLGEVTAPLTDSMKRKQRKQKAKAKHSEQLEEGQKQTKPTNANQQKQEKKIPAILKVEVKEEKNDTSESSDYEVRNEVKPDKIIKTEEAEESSDEDDESEEEEEESGDEQEEGDSEEDASDDEEEEEEEDNKKGKKPQPKQVQTPNLQQLQENEIVTKGQKRYVLFVGNLPYDATKVEISDHFKKAGLVRDIRIPVAKETNKPRGFAYVEFDNEISYQKGLSLHHTFIKGRQINVFYTQGGKKKNEGKKNEVKAKNLKLQAMRKQGQLVGSVKENQKRSARRAKQNAAKTPVNGS